MTSGTSNSPPNLINALKGTKAGKAIAGKLGEVKEFADNHPFKASILMIIAGLGILIGFYYLFGAHGSMSEASLMPLALGGAVLGMGITGLFFCLDKRFGNSRTYHTAKKIMKVVFPILGIAAFLAVAGFLTFHVGHHPSPSQMLDLNSGKSIISPNITSAGYYIGLPVLGGAIVAGGVGVCKSVIAFKTRRHSPRRKNSGNKPHANKALAGQTSQAPTTPPVSTNGMQQALGTDLNSSSRNSN